MFENIKIDWFEMVFFCFLGLGYENSSRSQKHQTWGAPKICQGWLFFYLLERGQQWNRHDQSLVELVSIRRCSSHYYTI